MPLPKYRLQPVLDKREKKKKDAEKALADARAELAKQQEVLRQREEDVVKATQKKEQYSADLMTKMQAGMETGKITSGKAYLEVLKQAIVTAKKKVEDQKKVVAEKEKKEKDAMLAVTDATKEMKVIEKHRENWADQLHKEEEYKEDQEQEEVAQNIYEQSRRQKQS